MQEHPEPRSDPSRRGERLTLAYLARRTRQELLDLDRGLLGTAWDLLWRPGQVTTAFIEGRLTRYYSPARYFVIITAVTVLVGAANAPLLDEGMIRVLQGRLSLEREVAASWVADWNAVLYAPLMLCLALCQRYFFRERALNLAEHLVIATYGWSQLLAVGLAALWIGQGLRELGLQPGAVTLTLLVPPAWWLYYCAGALRLRSAFDWIRAPVVLISALVLFLAVMALGAGLAASLRAGLGS
ncbi:DUF3667 domain-containing protein [Pseudomarimonas salicorniae]|uniref:DUF3667 domain-containing protein n=1 Tax=Pseudomarimonas salicorniae TaxID=2933270 RepID=A0ABT0GK38_9GAMM|nr:DUF3667 domain-containing protein [Lysobacter sp. CAU 1642]MCK7594909.1 DUF3667 domain-containing protein [Lysobacter sp. CAU 1642]